MTPWERYDGHRTTDPQLSIYGDATGHINAAADRMFFQDAEEITVFVDGDEHRIAFVPGCEGYQPLALSRSGKAGADVNIKSALRSAGVDVEELDGTTFIDLVEETVAGATAMVGDVSELAEDAETDAEVVEQSATDSGESETPPETEGVDDRPEDEETANAGDEDVTESEEDTVFESGTEPDENDPMAALRTFLQAKTNGGGRYCLEARQIAEHVPLSGRQVGHWMGKLRDESDEFDITHESHEDHEGWDRARWAFERATETEEPMDDTDHQVGDELPADLDESADVDDDPDQDDDEPAIEERLPEGVTVDDVHAAREDSRFIEDIAEDLEMPDDIGQTRTVLMLTDNYNGVREGAHSRRGST